MGGRHESGGAPAHAPPRVRTSIADAGDDSIDNFCHRRRTVEHQVCNAEKAWFTVGQHRFNGLADIMP